MLYMFVTPVDDCPGVVILEGGNFKSLKSSLSKDFLKTTCGLSFLAKDGFSSVIYAIFDLFLVLESEVLKQPLRTCGASYFVVFECN